MEIYVDDLDKIYECWDCDHKSNTWGEVDDKVEINADGEESQQLLCPKCESYSYYQIYPLRDNETGAYSMIRNSMSQEDYEVPIKECHGYNAASNSVVLFKAEVGIRDGEWFIESINNEEHEDRS